MTAGGMYETAVSDVGEGRPVVVVNRLLDVAAVGLSARHVTQDILNFFVTQCHGMIYVGMSQRRLLALGIPRQVGAGLSASNLFVAVDVALGTTTGISAADRARTITALSDPGTHPDAFTMPGHVVPLALDDNGVLGRWGTVEAFSEIARSAALPPPVAFITVLNARGEIAAPPDWEWLAREHGMSVCSIADVVRARRRRACREPVRDPRVESMELPYTGSMITCLTKSATPLRDTLPVAIHDLCTAAYLDAGGCPCRQALEWDRQAMREMSAGALCVVQSNLSSAACPRAEPRRTAAADRALADLIAAHTAGAQAVGFV